MKCYFAHPKLEDRKIKTLRNILSQYWKVIDPFDENIGIAYEDIVEFDYCLIDECDMIFIYIPLSDHRNIGVISEMIYAHGLEKLVYCLTYEENPFLNKYCNTVWLNWDDFINDL